MKYSFRPVRERVNGEKLKKSCDIVLKQLWSKGNKLIQRGYLENFQYCHSGGLWADKLCVELTLVNNVKLYFWHSTFPDLLARSPFSVRELRFLPLSQAQLAGKTYLFATKQVISTKTELDNQNETDRGMDK